MSENKYITVSEYAAANGISKQAVYKQLKRNLKPFLIVIDGKKYIDIAALTEESTPIQPNSTTEQPHSTTNSTTEQPHSTAKQPENNQFQLLLEEQLKEKDKTIERLLNQIESQQTQIGQLTELLRNSQVLLAVEKKMSLEEPKDTPQKTAPEPPQDKAEPPQEKGTPHRTAKNNQSTHIAKSNQPTHTQRDKPKEKNKRKTITFKNIFTKN